MSNPSQYPHPSFQRPPQQQPPAGGIHQPVPLPYGQPYPQPQPYGYTYAPHQPLPPAHPQASTAMILGLLSLFFCGLASPFAIYFGNKSLREINASGGQFGGRGQAQAGLILGVIGAVGTVLAFFFFIVMVAAGSGGGY